MPQTIPSSELFAQSQHKQTYLLVKIAVRTGRDTAVLVELKKEAVSGLHDKALNGQLFAVNVHKHANALKAGILGSWRPAGARLEPVRRLRSELVVPLLRKAK